MRYEMKVNFLVLLLGLFVLSCGQKQTEEQLRTQAQNYEKEENFEEAIKTYEKQLELYPNGKIADEAQQKIAFIYYNNFHDFNKAIEAHQRLIKKYPDSKYVSQARFMIGYIYANDLKDYDKARIAYNEFLTHHPESELVASVKWELEHLGRNINDLLIGKFGDEKSNSEAKSSK
ncbi:MAG: outer membrane protein assembly factor BamD [bacterium]